MFWRFGGYANISTLDTLLDKPDVTLEELLDESDLIQELKQHNTKLIEYLRDENVLRRLLEYVIAPKPPDAAEEGNALGSDQTHDGSPEKKRGRLRTMSRGEEELEREEKTRLKYSYVACEVLSSETWSISEALMENQQHLRQLWEFMKRKPPLDPLQAGYFTKVNETLLDKKTEEMLEFFKSLDGVVLSILQHVDCPMVMDLLLKIISLEKAEGGQGIVDWLQSQDLIPSLLSCLSAEHSSATQTSGGDFLKAIITISANASQNEQSCIGPNDLTRQLVSEPCITSLISNMLRGGNPLTVGVGIVIEVIRKNNSDYDPDVGAGADSIPSSRDPIYLGTLLRLFAKHVPDFMELILSPNHTVINCDGTSVTKRRELKAAFGEKIEPLGFDRFKTCELMAELLHCSNMGLLNEVGSETFIKERDQERLRLKQSEILDQHQIKIEPSKDATNLHSGASPSSLGDLSPGGTRRLEVQNGGDDDGFEDVAASGVLNEDVKDDFDEKIDVETDSKPTANDYAPNVRYEGRLDEEEFADEPLSSPRLEADPKAGASLQSSEPTADKPLSPTTSGLTEKVGDLELDNDAMMTGPPPPDSSLDDHQIEQSANNDTHSTQINLQPPIFEPPRDLSPHPDDKPAPLFSGLPDNSTHAENPEDSSSTVEHEIRGNVSQETIDTTLGEEGDSNRSVVMAGNSSGFEPHIEADLDGSPVVGDFLKMMFVEHRVVPTILDFFFRFPWNNFLHNVVYDVVQQVFNGPMDRGYNRNLAIDLFETGRITERIVEGQQRSDKAQAETSIRLGYMGHLTLIAEEVVKFSERHPAELLSQSVLEKVSNREWVNYVEQTLAETRERDNAILGGVRPDMSVGPRQAVINAVNAAQGFGSGSSSALTNAGLNGGASQGLDTIDLANSASASSGGFNLAGGSLLSGFGSSSDEEDEEMEEGEDDDGPRSTSDHFSRYASSSFADVDNFSSPPSIESSDAPPNAPPPPPPLNIPPSRARRQLAARLALHNKQNQARTSKGVEAGDNDGDIRSEEGHEVFALGSPTSNTLHEVSGSSPLSSPPQQTNRFMSRTMSDLFEQTSSSSSGSGSDNEEDDDLAQTGSAKPLEPRRPSTVEAATRSALEADDDEEDEVDYGREEEDEEDEKEGLVEIKKPRKGGLLEASAGDRI
ncbi:MAG: hypothetical protein M1836_002568 [Candelina mexicana]|nr:MAG: hypothetical protein M1836_002568 [Candelina mexicana]